MGQYYYFAASLPMLQPDSSPPLSSEEFMEMCERLLGAADYEAIRKAELGAPGPAVSKVELLRRYQDGELGLRNELVKLRAKRIDVDADMYLRQEQINPLWAGPAREILEQDNPLKREMRMTRVLWRLLDELGVGHYFDLDFLTAYYLKLQLLERVASFQAEAGKEKLDSILTGDDRDG